MGAIRNSVQPYHGTVERPDERDEGKASGGVSVYLAGYQHFQRSSYIAVSGRISSLRASSDSPALNAVTVAQLLTVYASRLSSVVKLCREWTYPHLLRLWAATRQEEGRASRRAVASLTGSPTSRAASARVSSSAIFPAST